MKNPLASTKVLQRTRSACRRVLIRPEHDAQLSWRLRIKGQKGKVPLLLSLPGPMSCCGQNQQGVRQPQSLVSPPSLTAIGLERISWSINSQNWRGGAAELSLRTH